MGRILGIYSKLISYRKATSYDLAKVTLGHQQHPPIAQCRWIIKRRVVHKNPKRNSNFSFHDHMINDKMLAFSLTCVQVPLRLVCFVFMLRHVIAPM